MSDEIQSEQVANMAKGWVQAPLDIPPLPMQERIAESIGAVDSQITTPDTEAEAETTRQAEWLAESLTTRQGEEWEEVRLREISFPLAGPAFKASVFTSTPVGPRLLRGINLGRSGTRWNDTETVFWPEAEIGAFQKYLLESGDVCIAMDRPFTRDRVLRCGLIQNADLPALLVQRVTRLRANLNRVLPEFLIFVVQSPSMAERLAGRQTPGGYVPHISGRDISEFTFALPPLSVQERIVEVIGAVDDQITALDAEANTLAGVYLAATSLLWLASQGAEAELRPLGDVMHLDVVRTPMEAGTTYHLAGVLNAGKGIVDKETFDGADTEYTAMNILRENQVVMRKLTAWEGPITVVPAEFDGFVASNEFPTFTLTDDIAPGWMKHVCRTPRLWAEMQSRVVGTVQRRKRLKPDQLLSIALPVPTRPEQEQAADALDAIEGQAAVIRAEADRLRSVRARLLSGLLDRTIDIESAKLEV